MKNEQYVNNYCTLSRSNNVNNTVSVIVIMIISIIRRYRNLRTWSTNVWLLTIIPFVVLLCKRSPSRDHHTLNTWKKYKSIVNNKLQVICKTNNPITNFVQVILEYFAALDKSLIYFTIAKYLVGQIAILSNVTFAEC